MAYINENLTSIIFSKYRNKSETWIGIRYLFLCLCIITTVLFVLPLESKDISNTKYGELEEIKIQSSDTQDREWNIVYLHPIGYFGSTQKLELKNSIFQSYPDSEPVAIFFYGGYHSEVTTNRTIKKTYPYSDFVEEVEDDEILAYSDFLRIHCRIPTATEFKLEKQGKLEGDYLSRAKKDINCEQKLISDTWKGNGFLFWFHQHYYQIPDVTKIKNIPGFLLYLGSVFSMVFIILALLFSIIKILISIQNFKLNVKIVSILGCIFMGFLLLALTVFLSQSNQPVPLGIRYYFQILLMFAGIYTILCFLPFWGLVNYILLGDRTFPLWLILLGFLIAPLLIFAAGAAKSGTRNTSRSKTSSSTSSSSSSTVSGEGGTFGGGGASGQW